MKEIYFNKLLENVASLSSFLKENNISPIHLDDSLNKETYVSINIVFLILFLPVHLIGLLSNYLPYKIPVWFVNKKVKDIHFHSSIKMTLGVILFILFWTTQLIIITSFFGIIIGWWLGKKIIIHFLNNKNIIFKLEDFDDLITYLIKNTY